MTEWYAIGWKACVLFCFWVAGYFTGKSRAKAESQIEQLRESIMKGGSFKK